MGPANLEVWLKGKLLLFVSTLPKLSFKKKKSGGGRGGRKPPKLLGKPPRPSPPPPPRCSQVCGKEAVFAPSNRDLGLSLQERWCNLQFVVVTNRELWPVFTLGALSFLFRWGKGGGAGEGGKKQPRARVWLFSN